MSTSASYMLLCAPDLVKWYSSRERKPDRLRASPVIQCYLPPVTGEHAPP